MSEEKFYDTKEEKVITLMTDYFNCAICGFDHFVYTTNPDFYSGASKLEWVQHCDNCGNTIQTDGKSYATATARKRYILLSRWEAEKEYREALASKSANKKPEIKKPVSKKK